MLKPVTCLLCLLCCLFSSGAAAQELRFGFPVRTLVRNGVLEGEYSTRTGVQIYRGVPFAAPPVDELRWQPPQPAADWDGVRQAKEFGPRPVQRYVYPDMRFRSPSVSEDCLYLNVWTPAKQGETGLPVLVYFYGGGFQAGAGDERRYDGEKLAGEGVVVVTPNYRLNIFGFLAHPELSAESGYGGSGNYGLMDQAMAIQWVKDNIEAFGGDPDKITIAGESAGSMSVSAQTVSPLARDLIAGAVGESGSVVNPQRPVTPLADGEAWGEKFLAANDFASIADLRAASTREIYEAFNDGQLGSPPVVLDGRFFTEDPAETFRNGDQAQVPLLVGWTSTERPWGQFPDNAADFRKQVAEQFPDNADEVLKYYDADAPTRSAIELASDTWIVLGTWNWADLHRRNSDQPVYRYRFDRIRPPLKGQENPMEMPGAAHATDIEYFMNSLAVSDAYDWQPEDRKTAETMLGYLANFVKTGDPNGDDLPEWPAVDDSENPPVMILDAESEARAFKAEPRYRYLAKMYTESRR